MELAKEYLEYNPNQDPNAKPKAQSGGCGG